VEFSFLLVQALSGLASASSLFIIASGLTLVFGVTGSTMLADINAGLAGATQGKEMIAAGVFLAPGAGLAGAGAGTGVPTNAFSSFSSTNTEPPEVNVFRFAPASFAFDASVEPSKYKTSPGPGFNSASVAVVLPGFDICSPGLGAPAFAVTAVGLPSLKIVTGLKTRNVIPSAEPITTLNTAPIVTSVQLGSYSPRLNFAHINFKESGLGRRCRRCRRLAGRGIRRAALFFVVGDIETRALKDESGAATDQTFKALFFAFRTLFQRFVAHRLELLKLVTAFLTGILVGGHS
jgi:hypothetical protein